MKIKGGKNNNTNYEVKEKAGVGEVYEPTGEVLEKGFNRVWNNYRFEDVEVKRLLQGEEVTVPTSKSPVAGFLQKGKYKGHEYWGFKIGIPIKLCGHVFTPEERQQLYAGEKIYVEDFWSTKKAKNYAAYIEWDEEDIVMSFDDEESWEDNVDDEEMDDTEEEI